MGYNTSRAADTRMVLDAVRGIVHALRTSSRRAERHAGISGARLFVLQKLGEAPGMSLNELAARTHTHQSSVSTVVTRLVVDGLVRRSRSTADRRSVHLSLTSRGRRMAAGAPDLVQERLVRAIDSLSPARRRLLASTLSELSSALDAKRNAPAMFFEQPPRRRPARSDG